MEHLGLQRLVPCATIAGKFWIVDWIKYGGQQQGRVPVSQVEKIKEKKICKGKTLVKDVGKYNFCKEFFTKMAKEVSEYYSAIASLAFL